MRKAAREIQKASDQPCCDTYKPFRDGSLEEVKKRSSDKDKFRNRGRKDREFLPPECLHEDDPESQHFSVREKV